MSESAAALVRTIAAVARPDARPPEDQVRTLEELLKHRRRVKRAHLVWTAAGSCQAVRRTNLPECFDPRKLCTRRLVKSMSLTTHWVRRAALPWC